jgi:hypothetical protein
MCSIDSSEKTAYTDQHNTPATIAVADLFILMGCSKAINK